MTESENTEQWIAACIEEARDGNLKDEDLAKLRRLLLASSEARNFFVEHNLNTHLFVATASLDLNNESELVVARQHPAGSGSIKRPIRKQANSPVTKMLVGLAAMLFVLVSGFAIWKMAGRNDSSASQISRLDLKIPSDELSVWRPNSSDPTIGVLLSANLVHWKDPDFQLAAGMPLRPGRLKLESGEAVIRFNSGTTVSLRGPGELQLISAAHVFLASGQLAGFVPKQAVGFKVDSPVIRVTDLGTEFVVKVEGPGEALVQVVDGLVRVEQPDRSPLEIDQKEASRFLDGGIKEEVEYDAALAKQTDGLNRREVIGVYTFDTTGDGTDSNPYKTDPSVASQSLMGDVRFHDFQYKGAKPAPFEFKENFNRWAFKHWHEEYKLNEYYVEFFVSTESAASVQLHNLALEIIRAGGKSTGKMAPKDGQLFVSTDRFKTWAKFVLLDNEETVSEPKQVMIDLSSLPPSPEFQFRFCFKGDTKARAIRLDEVALRLSVLDSIDQSNRD